MGNQQWYMFHLILYIIIVESFLSVIATLFNTLYNLASYLHILKHNVVYFIGSLGSLHNAMHSPSSYLFDNAFCLVR